MKKNLCLFILLTLATSACSVKKLPAKFNILNGTTSEQVNNVSTGTGIKSFANAEELRQFMSQNHGLGLGGAREMMALDSSLPQGAVAKSLAAPAAANSDSNARSPRYTETNNQTSGVDEPDIVKTNGKLLFFARNNSVEIIKSYPVQEAGLLKSLEFDGSINNIFIFQNKLAVFGTPNNFKPLPDDASSTPAASNASTGTTPQDSSVNGKIAAMPIWQNNSYTFLKVYDLSDPQNPILSMDLAFDGSATDARLINNHLYLITNKYNFDPASSDLAPLLYRGGRKLTDTAFPTVRYFDFPYQTYSFTSINAIDLSDDKSTPKREIYLLSGSETIYASNENLYIAYTSYLNEQDLLINKTREIIFDRLPARDQELIRQIDGLDESILSKAEKQSKIYALIMRFSSSLTEEEQKQIGEQVRAGIIAGHPNLRDELASTVIYKIKLSGLDIAYQNHAQVPGRLLNQFSMDEHSGNLRLATTKDQAWSQILGNEQLESSNAVYTLDRDMNRLGSLENLAPKERIYSARFLGDRAYLVTFVQTDPLFVIDLKDPAKPAVTGELKLPGFSNYLHPINDNILIGFGKDTKLNEWGGVVPTNLKIALFDVTEPSTPKILTEKTLGGEGSDSAALYDHKAFLYDAATGILALPVTLTADTKNQYGYSDLMFNGAVIYKFIDSKMEEVGKIDHGTKNTATGVIDYAKGVRRNVIINDNIYSLSENLLKINSLDKLAELKNIEFKSAAPIPTPYQTFRSGIEPLKSSGPSKQDGGTSTYDILP